jgi:magnesium-transporting ATPase (P-type)
MLFSNNYFYITSRLNIVYEGDTKVKSSSKTIRAVKFSPRKSNNQRGERRTYEILHILDFDPTRKRMSVIVNDMKSNEKILFCKGADNFIFKKCRADCNVESCSKSITYFSKKGWRTLALTYRILSETEYEFYDNLLISSSNDITNREIRMSAAFEEIESNLILVGATAIEDKLQDDVEDTLESLRMAGLKIWVLTGFEGIF